MVQLRPGILISDAYGSAGNVTAYHRGGKCFLRKRISPVYPSTSGQQKALSVHIRALQAWRSLPHEEQLRWEPYAAVVEPHRPPFDHKARISGNNLFISAYHGFATLGNEHVPSPAPFEAFPTFIVRLLGASVVDDTLLIRWKLIMEDCAGRYRLLTKVQLGKPGRGWDTGALRNFLAEPGASEAVQTTRITSYTSIWGLELDSFQVHARCILLDTKNGYRSQFFAVSGVVSLSEY